MEVIDLEKMLKGETTDDPTTRMPVTPGKWTRAELDHAVNFVNGIASVTNSDIAHEVAASLKIVRDGYAIEVHTCPTIAADSTISSKYPVLCTDCASSWGRSTPRKMIFRIDTDKGFMWVAAYFGVVFIMEKIGEPNTIEAAERFLDTFGPEGDEEMVYKMVEFYRDKAEEGLRTGIQERAEEAPVPSGEPERGN